MIKYIRGDNMAMKEGTKQIPLRIDSSLKLALEIEAYKQGRSLNNLLTQIIKEYLNAKK
jgi:predicted HicB family RNase H-like nuclease